jgi:hypothetical protein
MKKLLLLFILGFSILSIAQGKYEAGMKKGLSDAKNAKSSAEMLASSAFFERIANAEKDKWLPYYYASYYHLMAGWMDDKADKDKVAEKSMELIIKAEALESNNSELFCLRQMLATMQMTVDPMTRWMTYGQQASKALADAKKADSTNPRIYFLEGQSTMNTPEQFGGGKKKAKPILEKAVELYTNFQPVSEFHPTWGKEDAESSLKACN